ncbi:MAG: hypothetical protein SFW65_07940 [Alphaproteobacteria bacterium]|nr:hypothetical protein [Alphaproteobacteria bacterium]
MAYSAFARQPEYEVADDTLGGTSRPKQQGVVALAQRGEVGLEPDQHRIEAQKAAQLAKEQMAAALAARAAARENKPEDATPSATGEDGNPRVAALPEPAGMTRVLGGPTPPRDTTLST